MASLIFKAGNTAVITGGASGIGRALARKCTDAAMKVLVVDWDDAYLAEAAKDTKLMTIKADVSKTEDWAAVTKAVDEQLGGKISLLALNAGMGVPSGWDNPAAFRRTMDVNFFGVVNGLAALLPAARRAEASRVVITGSKQGITNPPGNPAYNASKAALRSVAEQLDYDLRGEDKIGAHLLVPGWTYTGMMVKAGLKEKPAGAWTSEQVVDYLVGKMDEGKFYVICPDNDVDEETDKKRMLWSMGDIVEGRPALTRWRDEWKGKAAEWMDRQKI